MSYKVGDIVYLYLKMSNELSVYDSADISKDRFGKIISINEKQEDLETITYKIKLLSNNNTIIEINELSAFTFKGIDELFEFVSPNKRSLINQIIKEWS